MSKLPAVSGRECVRALEKVNFFVISQTGSHIKMRRDAPYTQVIVPNARELAPGTLRSIIRQAGLSIQEFIDLL